MHYINVETLAYPVAESEIRAAFPDTSFPVPFQAPQPYALVFPAPQPEYSALTHFAREGAPALTSKGHWEQVWEIVALEPAQIDANLAVARAQKWEAIKAERDRRTQYGGYQVGGKWFHSDTFSRSQQVGLVIMGANMPPGLQWKTMDGSFVTMTPALAQQVFQAAAASDNALFQHAEALRLDVETAPNPSAIDIAAGWPPSFNDV